MDERTRRRGEPHTVERMEGSSKVIKNFRSVRVANKWNMLPVMIKSPDSANTFKNGLDNWQNRRKEEYGRIQSGRLERSALF